MRSTRVMVMLGLVSLGACTDDPAPVVAPSPSPPATTVSVAPSPSTPAALPPVEGGRTIARREDMTGPWKATVGAKKDSGALDVVVTCAGGGFVTVGYGPATFETPCDGTTVNSTRDEAIGPGTVTVAVTPDGDQPWSLLVTRGG
ncbi:hypothetical protein [Actinoplanes sp. NPDC048796]|uniref:hypothetical protein n=1 Tax=unclassified Actinoplanes TaxID=2626549 RepID=UPI00340A8DBC